MTANPTPDDYVDGRVKHPDPAVQVLIDNSYLGEWERSVTVEDLENAVKLIREVDAR